MELINTLGRRKKAVARAYVTAGKGKITANKKELNVYFPTAILQNKVLKPLKIAEIDGKFDIVLNLSGGGIKGQAEAASLAISRALVQSDEDIKPKLKAEGLMTRDPRMVERKKPGQKKARKKFQFSKR